MIQDNKKCCTRKLEVEELFVVKKVFSFRMYIFYDLKISQNFEMEICKGKRWRGILADKFSLKIKKYLLMIPYKTSVFFRIYCERLYTIQICQWHIQAVLETGLLVLVSKIWCPKNTLSFLLWVVFQQKICWSSDPSFDNASNYFEMP